MPKISVLIPIYNAEKYIEKCIESAVNQTLKDIEIIIINDGSDDSSLEIIKEFYDERIKIINKKNSGYGASLNTGLKEANGEYIAILEADDFMDQDMLKKLYSTSKSDVIKAGFYFYPENKSYNLNLNGPASIDDNPEIINIKPSIWSAIYKKDFLTKNSILFNESKGASYQDVSFHFKTMYLADEIYFLNEPLYFYRTDNEKSSVKNKNNPQAIIKEFKVIDKFLNNKKILPETMAQLILFKLKAFIWNYIRISKLYEDECINTSGASLKQENSKIFYNSRYIKFKDKIKFFLFKNYPKIFKELLNIIKKQESTKL